MPRPLSKDLHDCIVKWRMEGRTYEEIAQTASCSVGTVFNVLKCFHNYGQSTHPIAKDFGSLSSLKYGDLMFLDRLLEQDPCLYLDELQEKLREYRGIEVSLATVHRSLHRLAITRKCVIKEANERDDLLRAIWEGEMAQYRDPEVFVFLDESAVDNKTSQHFSGWSHRGVPCTRRATFVRGTRYSILPALSLDGIIALDIFAGSVNRDRFLSFLREQVVSTFLSLLRILTN